MAIYAFGADWAGYNKINDFRLEGMVSIGWSAEDSVDITNALRLIEIGDIVYIKSYHIKKSAIEIKAIGIVKDIRDSDNRLFPYIYWLPEREYKLFTKKELSYGKLNNQRPASFYKEYNPVIQKYIVETIMGIYDTIG